MPHRSRHWHVHVGAHKTATTHLQNILAEIRDEVRPYGVEIVPRDVFRLCFESILRTRRVSDRIWPAMGRTITRKIWHARRPVFRTGSDIVLSEELILGSCVDLFARSRLYFQFPSRLRAVSELRRPRDKLTLYLSIRSFDRVLPGAYATSLRFPGQTPPPIEEIRRRIRAAPPSWLDLIERIVAAAPDAELRVWRQEDYAGHPATFVSALTGVPMQDLPVLPYPASTMTPSADGVARAEETIAAGLAAHEHQGRIDALYAASPAGPDAPRYMPFDAEEREAMQARYRRDIEQIRERFPGMLIETPDTPSF